MSIQNIGRNRWRVKVKTSEITPSGKSRYIDKVFNGTKSEAQEYERKLSGVRSASMTSLTVGEYLTDTWLPSVKVQASTAEQYQHGVRYLAELHKQKLADLSPYDIERAIHSLPSGNRRAQARKVLGIALSAAERWKLIDSNPIRHAVITIGKSEIERKHEAYSLEELIKVIDEFENDIAEPVVILSGCCGLSREEALGLDWEDIDFESGSISITKAWVIDGDQIRLKDPKNNHRNRTVYLTGRFLDRLEVLAFGKTGAIWPGKDHIRIRPDAATRHFKRRIERAGLRYIPLNHLRHTYATIALAAGIDAALLSRSLGHSRISTTVDRYIRPLEEARKNAATVFALSLESSKNPAKSPILPKEI